jgi:hypothetical protein
MKQNSKIQFSDERSHPIFINSELDDYGLDPYEFRVYARIARRAGKKSNCFESIAEIAKGCRMSAGRVKKSLAKLIALNLISRDSIPGKTSHYKLTDPVAWEKPDPPGHETTQVTRQPRSPKIHDPDTTRPRSPDDPGREMSTTWVATDPPPGSSGGHEVYPFKKIPEVIPEIKDPLSFSPVGGDGVRESTHSLKQPEQPNSQNAIATATADPKQNPSTDQTKTSNGQDKSSARQRDPSKIIRSVQRQYGDDLPPWRSSWSVSGYHEGFIAHVLRIIIENSSSKRSRADAIAAVENAERDQAFGKLEARAQEWKAAAGTHRGKPPSSLTFTAVTDSALPSYQDLQDEIAQIQAALKVHNWAWDNPQVQLWINQAQDCARLKAWPTIDYQPILGCSNWPDWAIAKLAHDLHPKPTPPP